MARLMITGGFALGFYVGVVFRFLHPELTETQLFFANLPQILLGIGLMLLGVAILPLKYWR